jgi:hypothetical protein
VGGAHEVREVKTVGWNRKIKGTHKPLGCEAKLANLFLKLDDKNCMTLGIVEYLQ